MVNKENLDDISKQNFKSVEQIRSDLLRNQNVGHHE